MAEKKTTTISGRAAEDALRRAKTMSSQEDSKQKNPFVDNSTPKPVPEDKSASEPAPIDNSDRPKPNPKSPDGESNGTTGHSSSTAGMPTPGELKRKSVRAQAGALGIRLLRQSMSTMRSVSSQTTLDQGTARVVQTTLTTAAPVVTTARAAGALVTAAVATAYVKHIQDMYKGESILKDAGLTGNRMNASHVMSHLSTEQIKDLENQIPDHVKNLSGSKDFLHRHPHMGAGQKMVFSSVTGKGKHISDFEVHIIDLQHDAGKMKEAWKAFKKANGGARAVKDMLSKKTYRQMKRMVRQGKYGAHATKVLKRVPLNLARNLFRAAIQPLQNNEVMKGAQIGTSTVRVGKMGFRHVVKPIVHIVYNHGARIYNATRAMKVFSEMGLSKGQAIKGLFRVTGSQILKRIPIIGSKVYVPSEFCKDFTAKASEMATKAGKESLFAKRIKPMDLHKNPILRKLFMQNLTPDGMDAMGKGFFKKETRKMQKKVLKALRPNGLRDKAGRAVGRATKSAAKKAGKAILKSLKIIGKKVVQVIEKTIEAIASNPYVLIIVAIVLIICIVVSLITGAMNGSAKETNAQMQDQLFSLSTGDSKLFTQNAELILKQVKSCHDDMEKDLDSMMQKYPTADVQYPNGEEENYKEIWCAVSIMAQSNINNFSEDDLKEMAKTVYNNTHSITHNDYDYIDADGTKHTASHIFVNIARGSDLCYEAMSGQYRQAEDSDGGDVAGNAQLKAAMTVPNDDWLQIVQNMKEQIASFQAGYSQKDWLSITVNGQPMSVRQDCSGFVGACLMVYGSMSGPISSATLRSAASIPKFVKFNCSISGNSGWDSLQKGDIIVSDHHTEIFSHCDGNNHYVWNCGSDKSCNTPGLTNDPGNDNHYIYAFRPIVAGTDTVTSGGELNLAEQTDGSTEGGSTDASGGYPYLEEIELPMSNMPAMNEDTGNEDGYEDFLMQDVKNTKEKTKTFVADYFRGTSGASLNKKGASVSSNDFIRYLFSKHGVRFSMDNEIAVFSDGEIVSKKKLKKGDIIWYIPKTGVTNAIKKKAKSFSHVTEHEEVDLPDYGKVDAYQSLLDTVVPLIYIGDGKCVGYCADITQKTDEYESNGMMASVQTFKVDDLSKTRIWNCERYSEFTKGAVYGATNYFEGWTDTNIRLFLLLFNDDCWNTGTKTIIDWESEDSDTKTIDWSWYSGGSYETDKKYSSFEKDITFYKDVTGILKRRFTDDGLLPGTGYALSNALSKCRTTEESLSGNNIFEIGRVTGKDSLITQKYSYKGSGAPDIKNWEYRSYSCLEEACQDYAGRIQPSVKLAVTTEEQLMQLYVTNAISKSTLDAALSIYKTNKDKLDSADDIAIRRKEYVEKMKSYSQQVNGYNSVTAKTSVEAREKAAEFSSILTAYTDTTNGLAMFLTLNSDVSDNETTYLLYYYNQHIDGWNQTLKAWNDLASKLEQEELAAAQAAAEAEARAAAERAAQQSPSQQMPSVTTNPTTPSFSPSEEIRKATGQSGSSGKSKGGSKEKSGKGGKKGGSKGKGGKKKGGGFFDWLFG